MDISLVNVPASAKVSLVKWAEIVIEKWQFNLASKDLVDTSSLLDSFTSSVAADANNSSALISFAFLYYIRMIDMGVGKGVTLDQVDMVQQRRKIEGTHTGTRRRKIQVYAKTMYAEIMRLGELLAEQFATQGAAIVANSVEIN